MFKKFVMKTKNIPDISKFIGRTVLIDGAPVVIERIVGSLIKPPFFEINGEHLIGMLRFFAQMEGNKSITEEQFVAFEEIEYHVLTPDEVKRQSEPVNVDAIVDAAFEGAADVKAE